MDTQDEIRKHICIQCDNEALKGSDYCAACEDKAFKKIGGWLYIPALGLLLTTLMCLVGINNTARLILSHGDNFTPAGASVVYFELVGSVVQLLLTFYVASLFIRKKRGLPLAYIGFLIYGIAFVAIDLWLAKAFLDVQLTYTQVQPLIRGIIGACIWIPYFRVSVRVKRTFVH